MDYYFMYGGDADGVVAQVRHLTGEVPMFHFGLMVTGRARSVIRAKGKPWESCANTVN